MIHNCRVGHCRIIEPPRSEKVGRALSASAVLTGLWSVTRAVFPALKRWAIVTEVPTGQRIAKGNERAVAPP